MFKQPDGSHASRPRCQLRFWGRGRQTLDMPLALESTVAVGGAGAFVTVNLGFGGFWVPLWCFFTKLRNFGRHPKDPQVGPPPRFAKLRNFGRHPKDPQVGPPPGPSNTIGLQETGQKTHRRIPQISSICFQEISSKFFGKLLEQLPGLGWGTSLGVLRVSTKISKFCQPGWGTNLGVLTVPTKIL